MADVKDLTPDLERLDDQIDDLEDALEPLLDNFEELSSQLPLLDKAKLFALSAYAIESLLFSSLRIEGTDAQNHAVYTELKRIQQYFAKIKAAEEPQAPRTSSVNQEAAARILKADLSDNKDIKAKLQEKIAAERAKALLKTMEGGKKRSAEDSAAESSAADTAEKTKKKKSSKNQKGKTKSKK